MQNGQTPSIGIVGAGRSRQGLGPFLAKWLEHAGARVTHVSGRDATRTNEVAAALAQQLGHAVTACRDADELAQNVDAVVVACPVAGHLDGLDAALRAGKPCLCEKPLVHTRDAALGRQRVQQFRDRGLLLMENCQWPEVLPALDELHPEWREQPVRSLAMRLSPAWPGRAMVEDSLSHVLSMLQAVVPLGADARLVDVEQRDADEQATENVVRFGVLDGKERVAVELYLRCCPQQPRPAWFAINGVRLQRQLGDNYAISFVADDGRVANVQDPLDRLVYGFVQNLQANQRESIRANADVLALRIRLFTEVLAGID